VSDDDPEIPAAGPPAELRTSGRGLRLVSDLALEWGVASLAGGGKAIWFTLPL